tara:strand:- start:3700 stop:4131 length:432 start_codon:yes stop_codon:yes gene_type:complete
MFVKSKQFERNLKLSFYYKELSVKGSNGESVVLPVLDCLDNPKADTPHTKLFSMSKKRKFVDAGLYADTTQLRTILNEFYSFSTISEIQENSNTLLNTFIESTVNSGYNSKFITDVVFMATLQNKLLVQLYELHKSNLLITKN